MKKLVKRWNIVFIFLLFFSCSDFLELAPKNMLSEDVFYETPEQIEFALTGAYSILRSSGVTKNWYVLTEIPSDNTYGTPSGTVTDRDEFDNFYLRPLNPFLSAFWNDSYSGINRANKVIEELIDSDVDESLKTRYTLEAKFLRAFLHFNLVRIFGDVPLITKTVTISESYDILRTDKNEVYSQIITDLKDAAALPNSYTSQEDIGRATSGAAKSLLGKVYLTMGDYANAEIQLKEVIDSNQYSLIENSTPGTCDGFQEYFDPDNHNNPEAIFEAQFKKGGFGTGSGWVNTFAPGASGDNVVAVGGSSDDNIPEEGMWESWDEGDCRRDFSMALGYTNKTTGNWVNARHVRKYRDIPYANGDSNNNWPFLRYADVLLMYAECLIHSGDLTTAAEYINKTRRRGFGYQSSDVGSPADISASSKDQLLLAVEKERRNELAFEGHRWLDLVRTGRALEVLTAKGKKLNETNLIAPIPQSQIDANPKIKQNEYRIEPR
ncbi:MAG TPA: RagB/SusD family nutrient uptake outer membrane protein [Mariniphaga sp.]|nr:RagB/SusD family nutrient uptake outer membrane protein [Mariniphaga sp.]